MQAYSLYLYFQILGITNFKMCFKKLIPLPKLLVSQFNISLMMIYIIYVYKIFGFEQFGTWLDMLVINEVSGFLEYEIGDLSLVYSRNRLAS